MALVLLVMSAPFILLIFAVLGFVIYSYDVKVKILEKELEKHKPLTSDKLEPNREYTDEFKDHIREKELQIIKYNYEKLTKDQQEFFLKMYKSIDSMSREQCPWAYSQIMRTLNKG